MSVIDSCLNQTYYSIRGKNKHRTTSPLLQERWHNVLPGKRLPAVLRWDLFREPEPSHLPDDLLHSHTPIGHAFLEIS